MTIPKRVEKQLNRWNAIAILLRIAETGCVVLGIAGPVYLATAPDLPYGYIVVAAVSSLASLGAAALRLSHRANNWRAAWAGLNNAAAKYEMGLAGTDALGEALVHGEALIQNAAE